MTDETIIRETEPPDERVGQAELTDEIETRRRFTSSGIPTTFESDEQTRFDAARLNRWALEFAPAIRAFLKARGTAASDLDDRLQEVFLRAWRHRNRFVDSGRTRGYLFKIADQTACDHFRKRRVERATIEVGHLVDRSAETGEAAAERAERAKLLEIAMGALGDKQRRALLLRFYGRLSFAEIAEVMEIPTSTALSLASRGLAILQETLGPKLGGEE